MEELIGKVVVVKIIKKIDNWFVGTLLENQNQLVYIKDEGDYEEEELLGNQEKCIITDKKESVLVGFILSNRKFVNTMFKINNNLRNSEEYSSIKDIYLIQRLKIKGKILGLYRVDEGEISKIFNKEENIKCYRFGKEERNSLIANLGKAFMMSINTDTYDVGKEYYVLRDPPPRSSFAELRWRI